MKRFFSHRSLYTYGAISLIAAALLLIFGIFQNGESPYITTTIETGVVRQVVSVTGAIRAENTAELGFPIAGIVETVHVRKGDLVATNTPLISLSTAALVADVEDARAAVASARAELAELRAGVRQEARDTSDATVRVRTEILSRTRTDESQKIQNARRTLLSDGLTAQTSNSSEDAPAPLISGTYTCDREGAYTLSIYRSQSPSGYSVRVSGLESGTYTGATQQPAVFGSCGLRAQLAPQANYHNSVWTITIPNQDNPRYVVNKNAYELALENAASAIALAEQELAQAKAQAALTTAPTRAETLAQAEARVASAEARLSRAEAVARDGILRAPFGGTIVEVLAVTGEAVGTSPIVTLLAADRFELIARIPEIDVSRLTIGQKAEVVFDTAVNETQSATIDFISPSATVIDGVAYYEARLALETTPGWLRSGLNADIDIIINEHHGLRIPRRFVTEHAGEYSVLIPQGNTVATTTVSVELMGNDGFVGISGLAAGTTVVAP
jgi:multidrug efflux pump subunit AcrA (membrane-fusion protein)